MNSYRISLIERGRRAWWRLHGEQPLVTTFWPQDYPRGAEFQIGDQWYQITRYARAADPQFFEVWGKAVRRGVAQGSRSSLRLRGRRRKSPLRSRNSQRAPQASCRPIGSTHRRQVYPATKHQHYGTAAGRLPSSRFPF